MLTEGVKILNSKTAPFTGEGGGDFDHGWVRTHSNEECPGCAFISP